MFMFRCKHECLNMKIHCLLNMAQANTLTLFKSIAQYKGMLPINLSYFMTCMYQSNDFTEGHINNASPATES